MVNKKQKLIMRSIIFVKFKSEFKEQKELEADKKIRKSLNISKIKKLEVKK